MTSSNDRSDGLDRLRRGLDGLSGDPSTSTALTHDAAAADAVTRGRRYARRRRAGSVVVAAAALAVLGGLAVVQVGSQRADVVPAGTLEQPGLPDRLYAPSPWLPGTDDEAPGVLAVTIPAERASALGGAHQGVVGVSAADGAYRFLDLPDAAAHGSDLSALAPDGRHVAYWTTGGPTEETLSDDDAVVTGVAVYDTTTGDVVQHYLPSPHGLRATAIAWLDADSVLLGHTDRMLEDGRDVGASENPRWWVWRLSEGEPIAVRGSEPFADLAAAGDGLVLEGHGARGFRIFDAAAEALGQRGGGRDTLFRTRSLISPRWGSWNEVAVSPNGMAAVIGRVGGDTGLYTAPIAAAGIEVGPVPWTSVPLEATSPVDDVVGWVDARHVAVLAPTDDARTTSDLLSVDIRTGASELLVRLDGPDSGFDRQFATDLLGAPNFDAPPPPEPTDPRWTAGGAVATVVLAMLSILWWRRRVRA